MNLDTSSHIIVEFKDSSVTAKQDLSSYRHLVQVRFNNIKKLYESIARTNPGFTASIDLTIPFCFSDKSDVPISDNPALVFSKEKYSNNILIPSYNQLMGLHEFREVDVFDIPFSDKVSKLCFAGSLTNIYWNHRGIKHNERLKVGQLATENPELFDYFLSQPVGLDPIEWEEVLLHIQTSFPALYYNNRFIKGGSSHYPIEKQLLFKYLLCVDGHTCAWSRLPWQIYSNSVPIKIRNRHHDFVEWFYPFLNHSKHLIEIDTEDLIDLYNTLENKPQLAQDIAEAGRSFAKQFLTQEAAIRTFFSTLLQLTDQRKSK